MALIKHVFESVQFTPLMVFCVSLLRNGIWRVNSSFSIEFEINLKLFNYFFKYISNPDIFFEEMHL